MRNVIVFLISGKAEAGKDTMTKILLETFAFEKPVHLAYATRVKEIARELGWDGNKDEKGRALLQWLGDGVSQFNPTLWVDIIIEQIKKLHEENNSSIFIISDSRYKVEIERMKEVFGDSVIPIRVNRPNHKSSLTPEQLSHKSECDLDDYPFDYEINNISNIATLERNCFQLLKEIRFKYYI